MERMVRVTNSFCCKFKTLYIYELEGHMIDAAVKNSPDEAQDRKHATPNGQSGMFHADESYQGNDPRPEEETAQHKATVGGSDEYRIFGVGSKLRVIEEMKLYPEERGR